MKNTIKLLVVALIAVIGLSMAACPADDPGNDDSSSPAPQSVTYVSEDGDGNLYTLVITENTNRSARYAAKAGDSFTFKVELFNNGVYSVALLFSGTVGSVEDSGTEIEINITVNGEALTITIEGTEMTVISGDIVDEDGDEVVATPAALDPVTKTTLGEALSAANSLKKGTAVSANSTDVWTTVYWVTQGQMDSFKSAIAAAQAVYDAVDADQSRVNSARIALAAATNTFSGQKQSGAKVFSSADPVVLTMIFEKDDEGGFYDYYDEFKEVAALQQGSYHVLKYSFTSNVPIGAIGVYLINMGEHNNWNWNPLADWTTVELDMVAGQTYTGTIGIIAPNIPSNALPEGNRLFFLARNGNAYQAAPILMITKFEIEKVTPESPKSFMIFDEIEDYEPGSSRWRHFYLDPFEGTAVKKNEKYDIEYEFISSVGNNELILHLINMGDHNNWNWEPLSEWVSIKYNEEFFPGKTYTGTASITVTNDADASHPEGTKLVFSLGDWNISSVPVIVLTKFEIKKVD